MQARRFPRCFCCGAALCYFFLAGRCGAAVVRCVVRWWRSTHNKREASAFFFPSVCAVVFSLRCAYFSFPTKKRGKSHPLRSAVLFSCVGPAHGAPRDNADQSRNNAQQLCCGTNHDTMSLLIPLACLFWGDGEPERDLSVFCDPSPVAKPPNAVLYIVLWQSSIYTAAGNTERALLQQPVRGRECVCVCTSSAMWCVVQQSTSSRRRVVFVSSSVSRRRSPCDGGIIMV